MEFVILARICDEYAFYCYGLLRNSEKKFVRPLEVPLTWVGRFLARNVYVIAFYTGRS